MIHLPDPAATEALGADMARALVRSDHGLAVALNGELGAGKTALVRVVLGALGHADAVISPSYTLIEPYAVAGRSFHHMDLYRLADPEELEFLGIREIDVHRDWLFVEWAERGAGYLPPMDVSITLEYAEAGRIAHIQARTAHGSDFLSALQNTR